MRNLLIAILALFVTTTTFAQTADEMKAERQALKSELTSKDNNKIEKKLEALAPVGGSMADIISTALSPMPEIIKEKVEVPLRNLVGEKEARIVNKPESTNLQSVDALAEVGTSLLAVVVASEAVLSEYKVAIIESNDGEIDINKFSAKAEDYMSILPLLTQAALNVAEASKSITQVSNDIKKLNPLTAASTLKTAKWAIDAVDVSTNKISQCTSILQNLINSNKAANNL